MADETTNSPTGVPVIPPKVVPWLAALVGVAGVAMQFLPAHTIGFKLAAGIVSLGGLVGIASPGIRKAA
jgi:hypothetical protein